ncbi:type II secretion system secretin GspD [Marinomonas sp. THO17]|uniref:type II secretion system secretin GspD n=1 Tax=Marinomonas sp. THO17 TaxID=3149048 RepID=UPI00336C1F94
MRILYFLKILLTFVCIFGSYFVFAQTWKINLKQADISTFLNQVAEITGKNFILDPRVKGKITVIANTELDKEGVLQLMFSVLNVHKYAALETSNGIKIVPQDSSKQSGLMFDESGDALSGLIVTRVLPLKGASAIELVPILRPLVPPYGHLAAIGTINALVVSDHADNIRQLERLIERLDSTSEGEIRIVSLTHAWAGDLLNLLNNLSGSKETSSRNDVNGSTTKLIADERTNRIILKGQTSSLDYIESLIKRLDQPAQRTNRLHVIPLQYADAKETAELISSLLVNETNSSSGTQKKAPIVKPDVSMNRLVISSEPDVMVELRPIIQALDIPRAQVLIEAIIVEITMDGTDAFGFQWIIGDRENSSTPAAGTNFSNAGQTISSLVNSDSDNITLAPGITAGFGQTDNNGFNILGILQAIESNSNANLLSTPKIMTLDNKTSKILVGETRPFQTGAYADSSSNAFVTTKRHDIGLTLEVTPHINAGDEVKMDVTQIVEAASPEKSDLGVITTKREVTTTVIAGDQQTIVLGGLMKDNVTEIKQKVPVFGDLPFFGPLFRSTSTEKSKQNLLVFIKPTILRNKQHVNALSKETIQEFRSIELGLPTGLARPATLNSFYDE